MVKRIRVKIKILTPMFSYGQRSAEFRLTELKALMRTTFRELYTFKDIEDMRKKEALLFGDINIKGKSPITLRLLEISKSPARKELLPHKEKKKFQCLCLVEDTEVSFYIIANDNVDLNFYIHLLYQASFLGGLGKRCRKGFGSFTITEIYNDVKHCMMENDTSINEYITTSANQEKYPLEECRMEAIEGNQVYSYNNKGREDFPYIKKIIIIPDINGNLYEILKTLSRLSHNRVSGDEGYKDYISETDISILGNYGEVNKKINRFASPVCYTVTEHQNNKYVIIKVLNYNYVKKDLNKKDKEKELEEYVEYHIKNIITKI